MTFVILEWKIITNKGRIRGVKLFIREEKIFVKIRYI